MPQPMHIAQPGSLALSVVGVALLDNMFASREELMSSKKGRNRAWTRWVGACTLMLLLGCAQASPGHPATEAEWSKLVAERIRVGMVYAGPEMRRGEVGSTVLRLKIGRDGVIRSLKVAQSSGNVGLDNAALDAVWRARQLPPFAPGMVGDELTVNMPVQFDIQQGSGASPSRKPSTSDPADAVSTGGKAEEQRVFFDTLRQDSVKPERLTHMDPKTRLAVDVPPPLMPRASVRAKRQYDALIDVVSKSGLPPKVDNSPALCSVGFIARAAGQHSLVDSQVALENTAQWARALFSAVGTVEREDAFTHAGHGGIELVIAPRFGPGHAYQRMYVAVQEYPRGRVIVSCATHVDAMERAVPVFRSVRDGVSLGEP